MLEYEKPGENGISQPGNLQTEQKQGNNFECARQGYRADSEEQFREAMTVSGINYPTTGFIPDGQFHAFDGENIGEDNWLYWFDGRSGGWQDQDGRRWDWQDGWTRARRVWPEPKPVHKEIVPRDYPLDALPDAIRQAVGEVQSYTQAPVALVACSALSALSIAGQAHVDVRRDSNLDGPSSLFILSIADSGERKTTVDSYFSKVIRVYEAEQAEAKKPELQDYEANESIWKAKNAGIKDKIRQLVKKGEPTDELETALKELEKEKPFAPRVPRLNYTDTTSEELGHKLATGWPSGAITSSEAGLVFGGHAMSADALMRTLGLFNVLWDGGTAHIDRRTSKSFTLKGVRLTIGLQIQEATLSDFMKRGGDLASGIGFFPRCLIAWPESTQGKRTFKTAPDHWPAMAAFNQRMSEILNLPVPMDGVGSLRPIMLELSQAAKAAWIAFYNGIEHQQGNGGDLFDVRAIASKTADNAARIAALFHQFETGPYGEISKQTFEGAARIAGWHLHEAQRFFGGRAISDKQRQLAKLDQWLIDHCRQSGEQAVSTREITQRGPSKMRKSAALQAAIDDLSALDRIRQTKVGRKKMIEVNPALVRETADGF